MPADKWEKYAVPDTATSSGGDKWEKYAAPISLAPGGGPGSNPEPVGRFVSNFVSAVNPVPGVRQMATEAADPRIGLKRTLGTHLVDPQMEQFHQANEALHGRGEGQGMSLPNRLSLGFGHGLAGALPLVGPAAANVGEQIGEGDVAGGLGSGAGLITTVGAPDLIRGVGKGLMRTAEPIAENAAGLPYADRAFGRNGQGPGRTPGRAILDETTGVRPSTIARQGTIRLGDINKQLENVVGSSSANTHLQPARDVVAGKIATAGQRNSKLAPGRLQPMADYLGGEPTPNFTGNTEYPQGANTPLTITPTTSIIHGPNGPIPGTPKLSYGPQPSPVVAETQPPSTLLGMKRQLSDDFVRNWNPTVDTKGQLGVARQATHELGSELHRAVPASQPLDVRASSLIPATESSEIKSLRAGPVQNMLGRFGAHTGALLGAFEGGRLGGVPGAIAGFAGPELLANPTTQMVGARGLDLTGKGMSSPLVSPGFDPTRIRPPVMPIGRLTQTVPLIRERQTQ